MWRLAPRWKKLTHTNITPFRGVNTELFRLALVYDWGENDNIIQYLKSYPETCRLTLVSDGSMTLVTYQLRFGVTAIPSR